MDLRDQVITLDQAKKIFSLWWRKEPLFEYISTDWRDYSIHIFTSKPRDWSEYWEDYAAYTVSELLRFMQWWNLKAWHYLRIMWNQHNEMEIYKPVYNEKTYKSSDVSVFHTANNISVAESLGRCLIYLLENDLIWKEIE